LDVEPVAAAEAAWRGEVSEAWKAILRPLPTFAAIGMGL
jgi:hypothetical protein